MTPKRSDSTPKRSDINVEFRKTKRSVERRRDEKVDKKINLNEHKREFNSRLDILEKM